MSGNAASRMQLPFPLRQEGGGWRWIEERGAAETARLVLGIRPGERRLLPDFGWRGHFLEGLESPVERAVAGVLAEEALARWAPQLQVRRVDVAAAAGEEVVLTIHRPGERIELTVMRRRVAAPPAGGAP